MTKTEFKEELVTKGEDTTGSKFSGIVWVALTIALILSVIFSVIKHFFPNLLEN